MYLTPLFLPNFLKLQRRSFINFLNYGIKNEIQEYPSLLDKKKKIYLYFYPKFYQFNLPFDSCQNSIIYSKTYTCNIIIPVKLKQDKQEIAWININNIPIMTNKCHFIINGSPRILMSQITRAPGIYYHKDERRARSQKKIRLNSIYYADIIAERGNWLRLEIDIKNIIWIKTKKTLKLPILMTLQALGIKTNQILDFIQFPILNLKNNINNISSQKEALLRTRNLSKLNKTSINLNPWNKNRILVFEKFTDPIFYDLGKIGRLQMNKRFHYYNNIDSHILTPIDLLLSVKFLLKIKNKIENVDDIDNLKNKRVKIVGELLQNQFKIALIRLQRFIKRKVANNQKIYKLNNLFSSTPINTTLSEFFGINPLSQFMDEINPLAIITHKRRVSALGFGGVSRDTATLTLRSIHPTLQGRICPIETPEGKNAGLVNSFSLFSNVNKYGFIETPFFSLYNGKILYEMGIKYISATQENLINILSYDIKKTRIGFLPNNLLPIRIEDKIEELDSKNINVIGISRIQMLSIATSLIPFMEHNDANRILMGSNMQRQAVPLLKPEVCIVGTGLEKKIIRDLEETIKSNSSGFINYLSLKKIIIYSFIRQYKKYNKQNINSFFMRFKKINSFFYLRNNCYSFNIRLLNNLKVIVKKRKTLNISEYSSLINIQKISKQLYDYTSSNQGTCSINRIRVNEGGWIKKGESISNGLSNYHNEIALGYNLLLGYISWKGYNFEDAVIFNKKLVTNNIYTSTHIEKFDIEIKTDQQNNEIITPNIQGISLQCKKKLDLYGIIKIGSCVYNGDILVGKLIPNKKTFLSPYRKLLYEILQKKTETYKDTSFRVPKTKRGRVTFVDYSITDLFFSQLKKNIIQDNKYSLIKVHLLQNRRIQIGDKISGRHGNKGVISNIVIESSMPYLLDGSTLDLLLNPLGVPSRMNIGQVLECILGLSGNYLQKHYRIIPFDETFGFEISRNLVYSQLFFAGIKTGENWIFDIKSPGKNRLIDPDSGVQFDQPITIGKAYILKLIHLIEEKIHSRSTGPYSLVTQQPLKGKSKQGGQRIGEMEVWALEGYGAAYTLHEILTTKSDDIRSRQKVMTSIINNNSVKFGTTETFKVLIRELQSLCLNLQFFE
uniref:DNA-directed RNA polymerase subunit beta n=1 Tax=Gymnochlora stellata TaxID=67809 RepID=A0A140JZJ7_GYMST|nr:RNA polymerase beta subunit [Gymnochlora stellata]BAU62524.1 RNA polymerase beta subunit [Gymnochlora stellata]